MIKRIINTFTAMSLKKQASIYVAKCEYQKAIS